MGWLVSKKKKRPATSLLQAKTGKSSRFKGVSWDKVYQRWRAGISIDKKHTNLGTFINEADAARKYDEAALKAGRPLNFPEEEALRRASVAVGADTDEPHPKRRPRGSCGGVVSQYKGVTFSKASQKFIAQVR